MPLPKSEHTARPWRIHAIAHDFRVEDVWALPTPGGPGDFPRLVGLATSLDPGRSRSSAVRALFALRWRIGGLLGWDDPADAAATLRDRVPADLRGTVSDPAFAALPFSQIGRAHV